MKKIYLYLLLMIGGLFLVSGCSKNMEQKRSGFYLDHVFEVKINYKKDKKIIARTKKAVDETFKKLVEMDTNLNTLSTISEISAINSLAGVKSVEISQDTYNLIKKGYTGAIFTNGYFDISWAPLVDLFKNNNYPNYSKIQEAKQAIGYLNIQIDKNYTKIKLANANVKVNVDRIKRGYALDVMANYYQKKGIEKGYVKAGNLVRYIGKKAEEINLADKEILLDLTNKSFNKVTVKNDDYLKNSSTWSKYLPVETVNDNIKEITVVAPNAVTAEILTDAAFFMGVEKSLAFVKELKAKANDKALYNIFLVIDEKGEEVVTSSVVE